jgi:NAD+ kinase
MSRSILLVAHTGRVPAHEAARGTAARLREAGVTVRVLADEADELAIPDAVAVAEDGAANDVELVLVLGGDGTILRAAEIARAADVPLLGVNLGHVGFLAESEPAGLGDTVEHILRGDYTVEERMTVDVEVCGTDGPSWSGWALNEVSVEKSARERMVELVAEIDGRPLSTYGCDGLVLSTPTGSTAYAFSAGGPIVAPDVEALLLVPISAHALFARPLVVGPTSTIAVELLAHGSGALVCCDGRRIHDLPAGSRVEVRRGAQPVRLARIHQASFTERLVGKFDLPVHGWRGRDS